MVGKWARYFATEKPPALWNKRGLPSEIKPDAHCHCLCGVRRLSGADISLIRAHFVRRGFFQSQVRFRSVGHFFPLGMPTPEHVSRVLRLYRNALQHSRHWTIERVGRAAADGAGRGRAPLTKLPPFLCRCSRRGVSRPWSSVTASRRTSTRRASSRPRSSSSAARYGGHGGRTWTGVLCAGGDRLIAWFLFFSVPQAEFHASKHPDPYRRALWGGLTHDERGAGQLTLAHAACTSLDGTKWERNTPPPESVRLSFVCPFYPCPPAQGNVTYRAQPPSPARAGVPPVGRAAVVAQRQALLGISLPVAVCCFFLAIMI